jgi:hypothetical protein
MASRRDLVKSGLLALAPLPAVAGQGPASALEPAVFRAVYDERFPDGRAFAETAAARGWPARPIRGDVTRLWYDELDARWRQGPAAIAGVTTPASLFCLETLARDRGMRLVARTELARDGLVSWLIAPRGRTRA